MPASLDLKVKWVQNTQSVSDSGQRSAERRISRASLFREIESALAVPFDSYKNEPLNNKYVCNFFFVVAVARLFQPRDCSITESHHRVRGGGMRGAGC